MLASRTLLNGISVLSLKSSEQSIDDLSYKYNIADQRNFTDRIN